VSPLSGRKTVAVLLAMPKVWNVGRLSCKMLASSSYRGHAMTSNVQFTVQLILVLGWTAYVVAVFFRRASARSEI
jgi:hypothetical protein